MKTVFLFPGQGSQKVGMLHKMWAGDPVVKKVFAEAEQILEMPVYSLDTAGKLASTAYVQVCLLIAGVVSARRLAAQGVQADFVAGHSIGAFAAAVVSGVLSFKQALPLVYARGMLMQQAYPEGYGMAALVGLTAARVQLYINEHNKTHSAIYLANNNTEDQQVIAGRIDSMQVFIDSLGSAWLTKAKILDLSVPSHCELLNSVAADLKERLSVIELNEPIIPTASNHTGRLLRTAETVRTDLWMGVANTVKWYDATGLLYELGARVFIEMEPSGVLIKMTGSSLPDAKVIPMENNRADTVAWLWNSYRADVVE
ncbi:MAG: malonate decarboxylase subunit epsilon [Chitinophagaceae bacterium]